MGSNFARRAPRLLPYPGGKTFAFTIIDDTDQSTLENTRPIYDYLASLGLRTTRTVWVFDGETPADRICDTGDTLERKEFAAYICELQERGFEIALHNVSSQSSPRPRIAAGMERYREILGDYPKINVHHEKSRENLYFRFAQKGGAPASAFRSAAFRSLSRWLGRQSPHTPRDFPCCGELRESEYFWGDLCQEKIRYVRTNVFFQDLNTWKCSPGMPYESGETPFVNYWFDSSNGQDADAFQRVLSERQIDTLTAEDGCAIVYTHFGKGFVVEKSGRWEMDEGVKRQLRTIAGRADGWYAPAGEILDRLLAFQRVESFPIPRGIALANRNSSLIPSVTLRAAPGERYRDFGLAREFTADARGVIVLPMLPAESVVVLVRSDMAENWPPQPRFSWWEDCRTAVQKLQSRWRRDA